MLAAVVLAGGAATRFPGKLYTRGLHGELLIEHVVRVAARAATRVILVGRGEVGAPRVEGAELVLDDEGLRARGCRGPLAGVITAARLVDRLLVLSGDLGYVPLEALTTLLHVSGGFPVTMLYRCNGIVEPLTGAVIDSSVALRAERLCGILEPRPTLLARLAPLLHLHPAHLLAVNPSLLTSVNRPGDLTPPARPEACRAKPLVLRPPLSRATRVDSELLLSEAEWWLRRRIPHLALHAAKDALRLGGGERARRLAEEASRRLGVVLHEGSRKT